MIIQLLYGSLCSRQSLWVVNLVSMFRIGWRRVFAVLLHCIFLRLICNYGTDLSSIADESLVGEHVPAASFLYSLFIRNVCEFPTSVLCCLWVSSTFTSITWIFVYIGTCWSWQLKGLILIKTLCKNQQRSHFTYCPELIVDSKSYYRYLCDLLGIPVKLFVLQLLLTLFHFTTSFSY